jgi:hypothetical protein
MQPASCLTCDTKLLKFSADFTHLGVECCPVCHDECPDEKEIIEIESGGKALICCSLDRALNPTKHMALEQTSEWSTPTGVIQPE